MNIYHIAALLGFTAIAAALFVRYVHLAVDRGFRDLARAAGDASYRGGELIRIDSLLDGKVPVPDDAPPLPKPSNDGWRLLPPALSAAGALLLWGGLFSPSGESGTWIWGGLALSVPAAAAMLLAVRRRSGERTTELLRRRADLRRLEGDLDGSAADLRELLKLLPWDDAAWAEYADDLAGKDAFEAAREAVQTAARLDPDYEDYRGLAVSFALRMKRADLARTDLSEWEARIPRGEGPGAARRLAYAAAVELAEGNGEAARRLAGEAAGVDADAFGVAVDLDPALHPLREFLGPV